MQKIETERKLIIKIPPIEKLKSCGGFTESRITQIYLADPAATHRIRKREYSDGKVEYTENIKHRISSMSSIEDEREISKAEFLSLAEQRDERTQPLFKIRRTVDYRGFVLELDFYEKWLRTCVMEIELPGEEVSLALPDFIEVVRDVTGMREYSNHSMSRAFPEELI